jgi:hypothetical protein
VAVVAAPPLPFAAHVAPFDLRDAWHVRFSSHFLDEEDEVSGGAGPRAPASPALAVIEMRRMCRRKPS